MKALLEPVDDTDFIAAAKQFAHDIRSPLAALEVITQSTEPFSENQPILRAIAQRLKAISENLLSLDSRTPNDTHVTAAEIKRVTENIIREKVVQFGERTDIQVTRFPKHKFSIKANAVEFSRMISNFLDNSIQADAKSVRIGVTLSNRNMRVMIKDNGEGIDPKQIAALRTKQFTSTKPGGHGLGLKHAYQVLDQWNGKIRVFSRNGQGTTIAILVPLASR